MGRNYNNELDDITVQNPAYNPIEVKDRDDSGYSIVNETFNVPSAATYDGKYLSRLDQVPLQQSYFTCTIGGVSATVQRFGTTVAAGNIAIDFERGIAEFNSSNAGQEVVLNYTGRGTYISANIINQLSSEVEDMQKNPRVGLQLVETITPSDGDFLSYNNSTSTWENTQLTLGSVSDVTIDTIASGEILKWNGTSWINNTLSEAGIQEYAINLDRLGDVVVPDGATASFIAWSRSGTLQGTTATLRTESEVRSDLGLVIGTDVQAYSADLATVAGLGTGNQLIRTNPAGTALEWFTGSSVYSVLGHSHTATNIVDFGEAVDDRVNALVSVTSPIRKTYIDASNILSLELKDSDGSRWVGFDGGTSLSGVPLKIGDIDNLSAGTKISIDAVGDTITFSGDLVAGSASFSSSVKLNNLRDANNARFLNLTAAISGDGVVSLGDYDNVNTGAKIEILTGDGETYVTGDLVALGNQRIDGVLIAKDKVALGNVSSTTTDTVYIKGDDGSSAAAPRALYVVGGTGGNSIMTPPYGFPGGELVLLGGTGGSYSTLYFGEGGACQIVGGSGAGSAIALSGGAGGDAILKGGTGGQASTSSGTGGGGGDLLLDAGAGGAGLVTGATGAVKINTTNTGKLIISSQAAPASATAAGVAGEVRFDANYMYRCTATNTWKRVALSTW